MTQSTARSRTAAGSAGDDRRGDAADRRSPRGSASRWRRWPSARAATPSRAGRFCAALARTGRVNVIAECKRRSPSRGVLRADYDPVAIATRLRGGRRGGDLGADRADVLRRLARASARRCARRSTCRCCARTSSSREYQLLEARAAGADAVLLIVAALPPGGAEGAARSRAARTGSTCWSRCTTPTELAIAIDAGARDHRRQQPQPADARGRRARVGGADRADAGAT